MTIREALAEGAAALAAAGVENPGLDASLLLAEVLNISRSSLIAAAPDSLSETSFTAFNSFIKRRLAGECAAYITGKKEFYGLEFLVNPSVLVPRPDTEIAVETAIQLTKGYGLLRVLDLCTGSGAIAIALKHQMPELEVWATDISVEALEVARTNAVRFEKARLLPPDSIHFCQGDLFNALLTTPHSPLSLIISNPPYVPTAEIANLAAEVRKEPVLALDGGGDGLDLIRNIISRAPEFLSPGGILLLEADPRQMEAIAALLKKTGFTNIQVRRDLSGKDRITFAFSGFSPDNIHYAPIVLNLV